MDRLGGLGISLNVEGEPSFSFKPFGHTHPQGCGGWCPYDALLGSGLYQSISVFSQCFCALFVDSPSSFRSFRSFRPPAVVWIVWVVWASP